MNDEVYLTKEKHAALTAELEQLVTVGRTDIAKVLDSAKAMGDLKENAEYHQAREDQAIMEDRVGHITAVLKSATLIKSGKHTCVEIGAKITIAKKGSSTKSEYQIVGPEEVDPSAGKLSYDSPIVSAMMGKCEGDFFEFTTPNGDQVEWKVVEVK